MEYLSLGCILASFVILINRIRKQDRKLNRDLAVLNDKVARLYKQLSIVPHTVLETGEVIEVTNDGLNNNSSN